MKRWIGTALFLGLFCFGWCGRALADTVWVRDGRFAFEAEGMDAVFENILPGESGVKHYRLKNETDSRLVCSVREVKAEGSRLLMERLRCTLSWNSEELFSGTAEQLAGGSWKTQNAKDGVWVEAGEEALLAVTASLDVNADNRVMGTSCKLEIWFEGNTAGENPEQSAESSTERESSAGGNNAGAESESSAGGSSTGTESESSTEVRKPGGSGSIGAVKKPGVIQKRHEACGDAECGICGKGPGIQAPEAGAVPVTGGAVRHETSAGEAAPGEISPERMPETGTQMPESHSAARETYARKKGDAQNPEKTEPVTDAEEIRIRVPKTGDASPVRVLAVAAVLCLILLTVLLVLRAVRRKEDT